MRIPSLLAALLLASPFAWAQDDLGDADPFDQLAYNAGYTAAEQFAAQLGPAFDYDRFVQGLRMGLAGDSAQIAFSLGLRTGFQIREDTLSNIDPEVFLAGLREALDGTPSRLSDAQVEHAFAVAQDSLVQRQRRNEETAQLASLRERAPTDSAAAARLEAIRTNRAAADAFLAEVRQREGVQAMDNGVLYVVTRPGTGETPTSQSRVTIEYIGRFIDGEVFDQSSPGEPVTVPVRVFVEGFRAAVLDMQVGESRTIYLPPELAYGVLGSPGPDGEGGIPPNSALEFDVTLVETAEGAASPGFPPPPPPSRN